MGLYRIDARFRQRRNVTAGPVLTVVPGSGFTAEVAELAEKQDLNKEPRKPGVKRMRGWKMENG
jgi:hypothetical protein